MYSNLDRPCRKNLTSHGLIYMGGEEHEISVINISITGVLAELNNNKDIDIKYIFDSLLVSTIIDLYLPEMRLAGEVEVVRADMDDDHILLALEFKNIAFDIDEDLNKRKAYRKNIPDPGKILLNGEYRDFNAVNVSVEGLMICLSEAISIAEGTITRFEFKNVQPSLSKGFMILQDINYRFRKIPLSVWYRYCIFKTDDWDARLYAYENDLLYSFSIPALSGIGTRNYLMAKWDINDFAEIRIKYGITSVDESPNTTANREEVRFQLKIIF